jgi:hypothetical protein
MISKTPRFSNNLAPRRCLAALCVVATTLVVSCGGQSSGTSNSNGNGNGSGNGPQQGQDAGGTASFAISGAYNAQILTGAASPSEFITFLTTEGRWYALYYLRNNQYDVYPDIYTGTVTPTSASSATVAFQATQGLSSQVNHGNANITGGSSSSFHLELAGLTMPISNSSTIDPQYLPTLEGIEDEWDGYLKDGKSNAEPAIKLKFSSTGDLISNSSYANCSLDLKLSLKSASNHPYYSADLSLGGDTTLCARVRQNEGTPVHMTGIGLIYKSPAVGKTKRLELILTDSSGSGISFRGDQ